jgi:hypothetical protein
MKDGGDENEDKKMKEKDNYGVQVGQGTRRKKMRS